MGSKKKTGPGAASGSHAKERHRKDRKAIDWTAPPAPGLVAKLDKPQVNSKYKSYLEFVENPEKKKKKLEVLVTRIHLHSFPSSLY